MRVSLHIIRVERRCESVGVLLFLCEQCVENVGTAKQETQSQEGQMKRACKHGIYTLFTIYRFQLTCRGASFGTRTMCMCCFKKGRGTRCCAQYRKAPLSRSSSRAISKYQKADYARFSR